MELAKNPKYAEFKILGKPPTSLKITTETGEELDWSNLNNYINKKPTDTNVHYILFTTEDAFLKVEYQHQEDKNESVKHETPLISYRADGKIIFKQDASTPEEIEEFKNEYLGNILNVVETWGKPPKSKYIRKIEKIVNQNDIKLGLRELDYTDEYGVYIKKPHVPKSSTSIQSSTLTITNPITTKTITVSAVIIPKGTYLYRGIGFFGLFVETACLLVDPKRYETIPIVFFTTDPKIALGYSGKSKSGCIEIFTPKEDIQLVDFWSKPVIEDFVDITKFDDSTSIKLGDEGPYGKNVVGTQKSHIQSFFGTNKKSETDFLNDEKVKSEYTQLFKDGTFQTDSSGKTTGFLYKGLIWGPSEGQYKRNSVSEIDYYAYQQLFTQFPADISGFYCIEVPASSGGRFHSEIIIPSSILKTKFELLGRKQLGAQFGNKRKLTKKRKTYRKKKNQKKTRKQSTR